MKRPGTLRRCFAVMANPGPVISRFAGDFGILAALAIPALAFGLFFLQTALDMRDVRGSEDLLGFALMGAVIGTLGIPLLALTVWIFTRPFGGTHTAGWTVRAFGLAYAPALLYSILGLAANLLLGWRSALAFGVTGVLWTLSPILQTIRQMTGNRHRLSMFLATMTGLVVLLVWAILVGA